MTRIHVVSNDFLCGRRPGRERRYRTLRRGESGQALVLVLGLVVMITLGTVALVQNVSQHFPLVEHEVLQHEAYRAMEAGINEYLAKVNQNPDYVACPPAQVYTGYPGKWTLQGSPSLSGGLCTGLSYGAWTPVPNLASTKGQPAWFYFGSPTIKVCTGTQTGSKPQCPTSNVWVQLQVVGASGYTSSLSYSTATVQFQPTNGFLLNLWWLNYDQEDPAMLGSRTTCGYYYANDSNSQCKPVDLGSNDTITGDVFTNDVMYVCGSPTVNGTITSAEDGNNTPTASGATVADPKQSSCSDSPSGTGYSTMVGQNEPEPTDDEVLQSVAAASGCLYEGPTEILLADQTNPSGTGTQNWEMEVTSPDTPTLGASSGPNDKLNNPGNTNQCMPTSTGGWVPYPSNGVAFVENCASSCAFNPLSFYNSSDSAEYGQSATTNGDAIVEGTEKGPLTIAAQNNVVITGDLCYQSAASSSSWYPLSTSAGTAYVSTSCGPTLTSGVVTTPSASSSDVLGLVAYNYVELNHPNDQHTTTCSPMPSYGTGASLDCDLDPNSGTTYVDGVLLALNQQFWVTYFDQGNADGNLELFGTISEDWRGPVATLNTGTGQAQTGYNKNYVDDSRLGYLSPPRYQNPGTASWNIGSISTSTATCPTSLCSSKPPVS